MQKFKTFGQEFYPHESLRALKLIDKAGQRSRRELVEAVAALLPQESESTRRRLATKFLQRYLAPSPETRQRTHTLATNQPYVRLVARHRHTTAQIELLYLRLAQVDAIVGALARELFHPVCVTGEPPAGWSLDEFRARNGGQLFTEAPLLTRAFILDYARQQWGFTNSATLDRSLRVLQGAGLIASERMLELRRHPLAYRLSTHDVSPLTFVYGLYEEFLPTVSGMNHAISRDDIAGALFARTLLLSPAQIEEHCAVARRHQLVAMRGDGLKLIFGSLDALVDALLARAL
jgi:hypothetical protein